MNGTNSSRLVNNLKVSIELWMNHCSPLQFNWMINATLFRDTIYQVSILISIIIFVFLPSINSVFWCCVLTGLTLFRITDIGIALLKVAVFARYGSIPTAELSSEKIIRNTVAVFINYVEVSFWFSIVYLALEKFSDGQFIPPIVTRANAYLLSFSTLTTIGYGNFSPLGAWAVALCAYQAFISIITLSIVIGSLVSAATSKNDEKTLPKTTGLPKISKISWGSIYIWFIKRLITLTFFILIFCLIIITSKQT